MGMDIFDFIIVYTERLVNIVIPILALYFASRGIKTWQLDKITNMHSSIKSQLQSILCYDYNGNDDEINAIYKPTR